MDDNFALYIHWPFCVTKCPYCDFNSHTFNHIDHDVWEKSLLLELKYFGQKTAGRTLTSVFFGGGTPSLMKPSVTAKILDALCNYWNVKSDIEVSLEANPTSVEIKKFKGFRKAGINRISIGIQSFENESLKFLGRQHSGSDAKKAIQIAAKVFSRYSFDLIYALPNQTKNNWIKELKNALQLVGEHISLYQLNIESGTVFKKNNIRLPNSDLLAELYESTQETMDAYKMPCYEISNHSVAGAECRHNLTYWQGGDYIGIGPGAHGRLTINNQLLAFHQIHNPQSWIKAIQKNGHGTAKSRHITVKTRSEELIMMGLRTCEGINLKRFKKQTNKNLTDYINEEQLRHLIKNRFLKKTNLNIYATLSGRMCLNSVLKLLLI